MSHTCHLHKVKPNKREYDDNVDNDYVMLIDVSVVLFFHSLTSRGRRESILMQTNHCVLSALFLFIDSDLLLLDYYWSLLDYIKCNVDKLLLT